MVWWILKAIVARMLFQQFIALLKGFNHANEFFLPSNCFLRQYFFKSFIWKTRIWKKNGIFIVQFDCRIQFKSISEFSLWKLLTKTYFDAKIFFPRRLFEGFSSVEKINVRRLMLSLSHAMLFDEECEFWRNSFVESTPLLSQYKRVDP